MDFITSPFPVNVLPERLNRFVQEVADAVVCPVDFPANMVLAAIAGAIGTSRRVAVKDGWEEPPLLYLGIIGAPSSKKSPALKKIMEPFEDKQKALLKEFDKALDDYKQEFAIWESKEPKERGAKPEEPILRRLLIGDATFEAISKLLQENPRGLILTLDELSSWVKSMDQYRKGKGGDKEKWLSLWTCTLPPLDRVSRKRPIILYNPHIPVLGTTQPDKLKYFIFEDHDGFIDRILFAFPEEVLRAWSEKTITSDSRSYYKDLIFELLSLDHELDKQGRNTPKVLSFTAEAKRVFISFVNDNDLRINQEGNPLLKSAFGKLEAYFFRLALILQLAHDPQSTFIDTEAAAGAFALINYYRANLYKVQAYIKGKKVDTQLLELKEAIHSNGGNMTTRDLYSKKLTGIKSATAAKTILAKMEKLGYGRLEKIKNSSGGKPTYKFHLKTCVCESCNQQSPLNTVNQSLKKKT